MASEPKTQCPIPDSPSPGMELWVETDTHNALGFRYVIRSVDRRTYEVMHRGNLQKHPRSTWPSFIASIVGMGHPVYVDNALIDTLPTPEPPLDNTTTPEVFAMHRSGHQYPVQLPQARPKPATKPTFAMGTSVEGIVASGQRDARISRGIGEVLGHYTISKPRKSASGKTYCITVENGDSTYEVHVDPNWLVIPHCTCPDGKRLAQNNSESLCKHTIAALIKTETYAYQLIDLFL